MKRLGPRTRIAGLVALALLVGIVGYAAVVSPQRSELARDRSQIADAQSALAAAQAPQAAAVRPSAVPLYVLRRAMPPQDDVAGIIIELDRLAHLSGVALTSVMPAPRVDLGTGAMAVPVKVVVQGRYAEVERLLRSLRADVSLGADGARATGRLFVADQVGLDLGAAGSGLVTASLSLAAFDYGSPPPTSATPGTQAATAPGATTTTTSSSARAAPAAGGGSTN